jgi:hypothetical protein
LHLYEANIFFPYPHTLAYSESLVASATLAAPLIWLTDNPVLGYNFVLLLSFVLTGFGTYLLVYRLTGRRYAAFVAGLIFAFCIYRFSLLSKLQLLSTQWMPFTLLYLDQIANRKSQIANSLLFALFLSLQCLASFYYAFQSALTIALYLVWFAVTQRGVIRRDAAINFGLALMLAAIFIAPFIVTYLQVSQELGFERNTWELEEFSAVPADYFIARAGNWLYGKLTAPFAAPGGEGCLFPGVLVIVLGLYGASMSREKARSFYVLLALFALLMSFGPNLQLTRHVASPLPFPLP